MTSRPTKRVLIESPLAGDMKRNQIFARFCMRDSLRRGEAPYASHLLYTQVLDDTVREEREQGIEAGLLWGKPADLSAVYADLGVSDGMRRGIARADAEGREVAWRRLQDCWPEGWEQFLRETTPPSRLRRILRWIARAFIA